jgi:hypothetical protein
MSYQLGPRLEGVRQNINLIKLHVDSKAKTAIDIGCNEGVITCYLDALGLKVFGFEAGKDFADTAINFQKYNFSEAEICHAALSLEDLDNLPSVDVVLFLSVNQQIAKIYSKDYSERFFLKLFEKCNIQMFFQPCMIFKKYGGKQPFIENDVLSAKEYFDSLLYEAGELFTSEVVGISKNSIPASEPYRPLIVYKKFKSNNAISIPSIDDGVNVLRESSSKLLSVDISQCISPRDMQCFSREIGWHRFVSSTEYILEVLSKRESEFVYEDSPLYKYYQKVQPKLFGDLWAMAGRSEDIGVLSRMPLDRYVNWFPWFGLTDSPENMKIGVSLQPEIPEWDSHAFGPLARETGLEEIKRISKLLVKISNDGYSPEVNLDGFIRGYVLRKGAESRFAVTAGQHRLAILSVLEYENFTVKFQPGFERVVDVGEVELWPLVKNGVYTKQQAINIFNGVFEANGMMLSA